MKKIIVAIDAYEINMHVVDFACYIAKLTHSKLTGFFLENGNAKEISEIPVLQQEALGGKQQEAAEKIKLFDDNTRLFRDACNKRGANCAIHQISIPAADIIKETRFAEMIIVDPDMSLNGKLEGMPTVFIKELLAKSECPVVLAPYSFYGIDEVVFAYDGDAAAVYAIKQFTYLFPELTDNKITVLQVNENGSHFVTEKAKVEELLQLHYSGIGFQLLHGKASDELFGYLLGKKNAFVVMGAFGRSMLSGFFKHSTAELIIKTVNLPVFVAHHK